MNIIPLYPQPKPLPKTSRGLFQTLERSLKNAQVDLDKSIRLAKILAPILSDQSSNQRHLNVIYSDASVHEKVIAVLMLGFPKNRPLLKTLVDLLRHESEAMRMASAIAICGMRDGQNNEILADILQEALSEETSLEVRKSLEKSLSHLSDRREQHLDLSADFEPRS